MQAGNSVLHIGTVLRATFYMPATFALHIVQSIHSEIRFEDFLVNLARVIMILFRHHMQRLGVMFDQYDEEVLVSETPPEVKHNQK